MTNASPWWRKLRTRKTHPQLPAVSTPTPLSVRRIGDALAVHDFTFEVDDDGDLTGLWDGHQVWFMLRGERHEIIQVLGRWSISIPETSRLSVLQAANDWNRDQLLPKAYTRAEGSSLTLYADHAVVLYGGATDEQLSQVLLSALVTTLRLFGALSGRVPA